jgi:hypothetical protein
MTLGRGQGLALIEGRTARGGNRIVAATGAPMGPENAVDRGRICFIEFCEPPNGTNTPMLALSRALVGMGIPSHRLHRFGIVRLVGRGLGKFELSRNLARRPRRACLVTLCWPNDGPAFPYGMVHQLIPWICDCWPRNYDQWERLLKRNRTQMAFFSARGSAEYFQERIPGLKSVWMPEACDPVEYDPGRPLTARSIDVLEIGRKHQRFHQAVVAPLRAAGWAHVFAETWGKPVYPDQATLHAALGDSVVSICFPRMDTHPELAGGLETVTLRYFESIASGCIVLGRCPAELETLFGYNPVIEIDWKDPWSQLAEILEKRGDYQKLVDRNLARLREVGTWKARAQSIVAALEAEGWTVPRQSRKVAIPAEPGAPTTQTTA